MLSAVSTAGERGVAAPSSAHEAWRLLFGLWTSLRPHLSATLAEEDLTPMQAMTLSVLDPDEPRPMGDSRASSRATTPTSPASSIASRSAACSSAGLRPATAA